MRIGKWLLTLLLLHSWSATASATVTVYYFHGAIRCDSCLMIEEMTEGVLEQSFADDLDKGLLNWQPINIDLPENQHFVGQFDLSANELVICKEPAQETFTKLPDVWTLVNDYEKFKESLIKVVNQVLEKSD